MNTPFPVKKILILVVILALPGFLYYLLKEKGKNRYHPLEIYGPKKLSGTFHLYRGNKIPDTVYHQVDDFSLTGQDGKPVVFAVDTMTIHVTCFFSSRSPNTSAILGAMKKLAVEYQQNKRLRFLSISVERAPDPALLRSLSQHYRAKKNKWDFVTGNDSVICRIAAEGFLADVVKDTTGTGYITSPMLILTDPYRRIRGYYNSSDTLQVDKLIDEIKVLIAEELRKVTAT